MTIERLEIWNRALQRMEVELVYGEPPMRLAYGSWPGRLALDHVFTQPWVSRLYGTLQDGRLSKAKIEPFIQKFGVKMEEYEAREYRTFNDFFTRKFRPGEREFALEPGKLPAPCEGRYLAFAAVAKDEPVPVKGVWLRIQELIGREEWVRAFDGGPAFVARLCPVDYHRFHFPDSGRKLDSYRLRGPLHSVNPLALKAKSDILFTNERAVTILETKHFGKMAYIEVGAMMVGKIVESHKGTEFLRGDEKGYFLFGASTVILVGEPGGFRPDPDIFSKSEAEVESLVRLGEPIASR